MDQVWLDALLFTAGLGLGIAISVVRESSLPRAVQRRVERQHVHQHRLVSREHTAGKDVEIWVCYEHKVPDIERRVIG